MQIERACVTRRVILEWIFTSSKINNVDDMNVRQKSSQSVCTILSIATNASSYLMLY